MSIIKKWEVTNIHTGHTLLVDAIGPRDAIFSIAGYGYYREEGKYIYVGDWKVNTKEESNA